MNIVVCDENKYTFINTKTCEPIKFTGRRRKMSRQNKKKVISGVKKNYN